MPIDWDKRVRTALLARLAQSGWKWVSFPRIGVVYQKDDYAIMMDAVGIFLFWRVGGRWERIQGLSFSNMRSIIETPMITFMDGSTLTFSGGALDNPQTLES